MAFDGIVTKCVINELTENLVGGRIDKIFQPEADEIILNIRGTNESFKLLLSANASFPRIHLTKASRENPVAPPVFCMLLRKHLSGGRILSIEFSDYERTIAINIESLTEMGDLTKKKLIIEIMGRHSNIILINQNNKIIDAIKHVDIDISSKREVMPAREYLIPPIQEKESIETINLKELFSGEELAYEIVTEKYLLGKIKGFSPLICKEICFCAEIEQNLTVNKLNNMQKQQIISKLFTVKAAIVNQDFNPCIISSEQDQDLPLDFHCLTITQNKCINTYSSINDVLEIFYAKRDKKEREKQKKSDISKVLSNNLDRCLKKLALQNEKLRDVKDRENLKLFGELITANIYQIPHEIKTISLQNYYSEDLNSINIPLDVQLTPAENAQKYFKKYTKAKSTFLNTNKQIEETILEKDYLESVIHLLEGCETLQEIEEIRLELINQGYMKQKKTFGMKKKLTALKPLTFKSSDGYEIFVGRNNVQNDLLTLKLSSSTDLWLHTKNIPGSHVIIRKLQGEIPEKTIVEAANICAFYSKAKNSSNVSVDYTLVKNVKKPSGAKPGMVIYVNNKTVVVTPNEELVKQLEIN